MNYAWGGNKYHPKEGTFGVRLLTSLTDSLVDVEEESKKRSDGRSKRGTEVTDA